MVVVKRLATGEPRENPRIVGGVLEAGDHGLPFLVVHRVLDYLPAVGFALGRQRQVHQAGAAVIQEQAERGDQQGDQK